MSGSVVISELQIHHRVGRLVGRVSAARRQNGENGALGVGQDGLPAAVGYVMGFAQHFCSVAQRDFRRAVDIAHGEKGQP